MTHPITRREVLGLVGAGAAGLLYPGLFAAAGERLGCKNLGMGAEPVHPPGDFIEAVHLGREDHLVVIVSSDLLGSVPVDLRDVGAQERAEPELDVVALIAGQYPPGVSKVFLERIPLGAAERMRRTREVTKSAEFQRSHFAMMAAVADDVPGVAMEHQPIRVKRQREPGCMTVHAAGRRRPRPAARPGGR